MEKKLYALFSFLTTIFRSNNPKDRVWGAAYEISQVNGCGLFLKSDICGGVVLKPVKVDVFFDYITDSGHA